MSLSQKLKSLRTEHNMTQRELAEKMNVARTTITGYETKSRQPSFEKLTVLAEIFNVSVDYLINDNDHNITPPIIQNIYREQTIDRRVLAIYKRLSPSSKEEVLRYVQLLGIWEDQNPDANKQ